MSEKKTVLSDFKDENTEGEYRFVLKTNLISHDLFFKFLFCEKDFAVAFLRKQLPPRFASRLDFANLIVESPNFLDEQFHEQRADVIFQIPFFTEDPDEEETVESVRIFVVLEHKSYYDHYTVFQLTKYVVSIMDRSFHQKKEKEEGKKKTRKGKDVKIPPVIPFIIHQGKRRFSAPRNLVDLSMDSLDASPYLLNLSPILFDLASIKEDHLPNDENYPALNLGLKIMQGIFKKDIAYTTKEVLSKLEPYKDQQFGRDLIRTILLYVAKNGQYIKKEEIHEIGNTIHFNKEDKMAFISVADKIYLEGKAEGIAEGIAEGEARGEAKSIISILKKRFSEVSSDLCEAIREKQDSIVLESLLVVALDCSSIEEFSKVLEK